MDGVYKAPWIGLLGLTVGFLTQPLGHTVYKVMEKGLGDYVYYGAVAVGLLGLTLIWQGLKRKELEASILGMLGGWFTWIGFFEFSFKFYAELYDVPPYPVDAVYSAAPQANILQASLPLMFALFMIYGMFNRNTKCNLMRFFMRRTPLDPGMPQPDNGRAFARVTAMEIIFVTWFCYLFWLYVIYVGIAPPGVYYVMGAFVLWSIWAAYLVYRATKQVRAAPALRYGIGAGIVLWGSAEMPAHFGAYREYWLYPHEYPVFNAIVSLVFIGGIVLLARRPVKPTAAPPSAQPAG